MKILAPRESVHVYKTCKLIQKASRGIKMEQSILFKSLDEYYVSGNFKTSLKSTGMSKTDPAITGCEEYYLPCIPEAAAVRGFGGGRVGLEAEPHGGGLSSTIATVTASALAASLNTYEKKVSVKNHNHNHYKFIWKTNKSKLIHWEMKEKLCVLMYGYQLLAICIKADENFLYCLN